MVLNDTLISLTLYSYGEVCYTWVGMNDLEVKIENKLFTVVSLLHLGPVTRNLVSASRWLRSIKPYRFPWYLTLVSLTMLRHNPGLIGKTLILSRRWLPDYGLGFNRHWSLVIRVKLWLEMVSFHKLFWWHYSRTLVRSFATLYTQN